MALSATVHEVPLATGGLNLKVDPQMLQPGTLAQADNVIYLSDGTLRKRYGLTAAFPGLTPIQTPTALFVTADGNPGYVNGLTSGRNFLSAVGNPSVASSYARILEIPFYKDASGYLYAPQNFDMVTNSTQMIMAWDYDVDPTATHKCVIYYGIWNQAAAHWDAVPQLLPVPASATFPIGAAVVVGASTPKLFVTTGSAYDTQVAVLVALQGTNGGLLYTQLAVTGISNGAATGAITIVPGSTTQSPSSASAFSRPVLSSLVGATGSGTFLYFSYVYAYPGGAVRVGQIRVDTQAPQTPALSTNFGTLAVPVSIVWTSTAHSNAILIDGNGVQELRNMLTNVSGTHVANAGVMSGSATSSIAAGTDNTNIWMAQAQTDGTYKYYVTDKGLASVIASGTVSIMKGATQWRFASPIIMGPAISDSQASPMVWIAYTGNVAGSPQKTLLLVMLQTGKVVGKAAYLSANTTTTAGASSLPLVPQNMSGIVPGSNAPASMLYAFGTSGALTADGLGNLISAPQITVLQTSWGATQAVEVPPMGTLTNGLAPTYITETDGSGLGFSYSPDTPTTGYTQTNIGNVVGTVQYIAVYRYIDAYNNVHWSAPGAAVSLTVSTASSTAKITLPVVPAPDHGDIVWFRTIASGTTFYQVATTSVSNVVVDNIADATLSAANVFLYTTGGEVANDPPPGATVIAVAGQRAYAVSAEQPWLLYYSKTFRQGHPVEFSAGQYLAVAPQTGAITALGTMDDKLVIFKPNSVFILSGEGPSVTGIGAFYGPTPVATVSGCTSLNSIVTTDDGVYYESAQGIELLGRNLLSQYVGLPIDGSVGTIAAAVSTPTSGLIRFSDITNACIWVYDTIARRWARHTYARGGYTGGLICGNAGSYWAWIGTKLDVESAGTFGDDGNAVQPIIQTGDIPIAGMRQAWARLRRIKLLGKARTAGSITCTVQMAYDGSSAFTDTLTITQTPGLGSALHARSRVPRQRMETVRFLIQWPSNTMDDLQLSAIALEVAVKAGVYKLPATQSY